MIVSGSASQSLAAALAREMDEPLAPVDYDRFPDGEQLVQVGADLDGERVVVVGSTPTSDAHVELLLLQDAAREAGASEVVTVIPYMGYARQDEAFEAGQPVSARAVAKAISTGADRVLTVTPHEESVCEHFDPTAESVDAGPLLADPLPADLADPLFLSPDTGAIDLAESVRDRYGRGGADAFQKHRRSGTEVEVTAGDTPVADREVVLVDDIVATGSTMSESIRILHDRGAAAVYVTCVHPLLARNAYTRLSRAGVTAVHATDTLERRVSTVSVAPALATRL